ncbi:major capsid protein [Blackfly microvirus SF02]|uniref:Major capsid protein n=1 Tax=Blackfly microvirus SF02 TaxID=2576452 RepID=A0A4P8PP74_9VIRU|nr:major capsid protein [Blackfly microvirus SF02]
MKSNLFNSIMVKAPNRNVFDLSHDVKLSMDMGLLIPTLALECVPGDKFQLSCESLVRYAPLLAPVMHRMDITHHYFFVPNRLVWPNWEIFITNGGPSNIVPLPAFPTITVDEGNYNLLKDYLGIPEPIGSNSEEVSALPFAMYNLIWNEFYRDQNQRSPMNASLVDGDNTPGYNTTDLQRRCWEHDYFTAALPFAQAGAAVSIPATQFDDVLVKAFSGPDPSYDIATSDPLTFLHVDRGSTDMDPQPPTQTLYAETSELEGNPVSINELRTAFRLQEWLEKAARSGRRYIETIKSFFNVTTQDYRLQRPEYITGTKSPVVISEVLNTTGTDDAPQGNMAGHGLAITGGKSGGYFCREHGYLFCISSIMPKPAYQQGLSRHWLKRTPTDYFWEQFANIGEQEILKKELYAFQGVSGTFTFGYIPRYSEYKYEPSRVCGDFRNSLSFWHLGRIFTSAPDLNSAFVECTPTTRVFAVETGVQHIWAHIYHKIRAVRPMPKYGTPSF